MGLQTELVGTHNRGHKVAMTMHHKTDTPNGAVVYTEPYRSTDTEFNPFINSEVGINMNVNGAFGGTPELVHDGIDTVAWTGSNIVGGKATFNSTDRPLNGSASVKVDNPAINDIWQFDRGSYLTVSNHVALTMSINIDKDWSSGDSVSVYCYDTGSATVIGSPVLIEDYISEFSFDVWQVVSVSFSDLGISVTDFDAIRMEHVSKGGGKSPKFYLDDIEFQQAGTPVEFRTFTDFGKKYFINTLRIIIADSDPSTLVNGTMPAISYNKILGLAKLENGIILSRVHDGVTTFSVPLTCIGDLIDIGFSIVDNISDGTNTMIALETTFLESLTVEGGRNSYISLKVSDDLSGLVSLKAIARGTIEV